MFKVFKTSPFKFSKTRKTVLTRFQNKNLTKTNRNHAELLDSDFIL